MKKDFNKKGEYTGHNPYIQEIYKPVDPRFGSACITLLFVIVFMVLILAGSAVFLNWYFGGLWK